jgi:hypothetical protein
MIGGRDAPGLPKFPPTRLVHAEQTIEILRPIPTEVKKEDGFHLVKKLVGVLDKGLFRFFPPSSKYSAGFLFNKSKIQAKASLSNKNRAWWTKMAQSTHVNSYVNLCVILLLMTENSDCPSLSDPVVDLQLWKQSTQRLPKVDPARSTCTGQSEASFPSA